MAPSPSRRVVGRDAELARLAGWVRALRNGQGRALLVVGEPGIGKTMLVRLAADRAAEQGCRVLWGAGDEFATPLLLGPLLEALADGPAGDVHRHPIAARLLDGAGAAKSSDDLITAAGEQIIATIGDVAFAEPTILVLDDLQWCDPATLAVWGRLTRLAEELPLLLIGTLRLPPRDGHVLAVERSVPAGSRLRLGPLGQQPVTELVGALCGGEPDRRLLQLAAGAAGNPLYLTELLDALVRGGSLRTTKPGRIGVVRGAAPRTLTAAIQARLDVLEPDTRQVLRMAALLGADFSVADLAAVSGRTSPAARRRAPRGAGRRHPQRRRAGVPAPDAAHRALRGPGTRAPHRLAPRGGGGARPLRCVARARRAPAAADPAGGGRRAGAGAGRTCRTGSPPGCRTPSPSCWSGRRRVRCGC